MLPFWKKIVQKKKSIRKKDQYESSVIKMLQQALFSSLLKVT